MCDEYISKHCTDSRECLTPCRLELYIFLHMLFSYRRNQHYNHRVLDDSESDSSLRVGITLSPFASFNCNQLGININMDSPKANK